MATAKLAGDKAGSVLFSMQFHHDDDDDDDAALEK